MSGRRSALFDVDRGPIGVLGILAAAVALAVTADQYGSIGGALLVLAIVLPAPYAVALGHVLLVALNPGSLDPVVLAIVEAGLLAALLDAGAWGTRGREAVVTLASIGLVVGVAWASLRWGASLWTSAGALGLLLALVSYGLHRYELVLLDLVEVDG